MIGEAFSKTTTTFGYCVHPKDACCRRCWSGLTKCIYISSIALDAYHRGYSFAFGDTLKAVIVFSRYESRGLLYVPLYCTMDDTARES